MSVVPLSTEGVTEPSHGVVSPPEVQDAFATVPLFFVLSDSCWSVWNRKQPQFVLWVVVWVCAC